MIDRNAHYWIKMAPQENIFGIVLQSGNERDLRWVECTIDETRYNLDDQYKVTLRAIDPKFGSHDFYYYDFLSGIRDGFYFKADGKIKPHYVQWFTELCPMVYIRNSGWILA